MPRPLFRAARLALAIALAAITTAACTGTAPPPPAATKIATLDPVSSGHGYVDAVALAPDATLVATGERAGEIRIWPTAGDPAPAALQARKEAIADLTFSPDGGLLASIGRAAASRFASTAPAHGSVSSVRRRSSLSTSRPCRRSCAFRTSTDR